MMRRCNRAMASSLWRRRWRPAERLRKLREEVIGTLEVTSTEKIAQYRLRIFGAADYPDGTATPRVEFGVVKGYVDARRNAALRVHVQRAVLPQGQRRAVAGSDRWVDLRQALDPVRPLNFVSTGDIGGGDYGSRW